MYWMNRPALDLHLQKHAALFLFILTSLISSQGSNENFTSQPLKDNHINISHNCIIKTFTMNHMINSRSQTLRTANCIPIQKNNRLYVNPCCFPYHLLFFILLGLNGARLYMNTLQQGIKEPSSLVPIYAYNTKTLPRKMEITFFCTGKSTQTARFVCPKIFNNFIIATLISMILIMCNTMTHPVFCNPNVQHHPFHSK